MVPFLAKQTQRTIVTCTIDWTVIGMKQFLYAIHQHSEKRIDIHSKVTFGFKYVMSANSEGSGETAQMRRLA